VVDREMTSCVHWGAWKWAEATERSARLAGASKPLEVYKATCLAPAGDEGKSFS